MSKPTADKQAVINLTTRDWDANILNGNLDACIEFYTEDVVRIQNGEKFTGRDEIRAMFSSVNPGSTQPGRCRKHLLDTNF